MNHRQLLILLPILGVLTVALYVVGSLAREKSAFSSCQSNLKQIGLGLSQYERDYDEKTAPKENWKVVLQPYTKNPPIFDCPSGKFNYSFNSYVSGVSQAWIADYTGTPKVFDSTSSQLSASDFGTSYPSKGAHPIWKRGRGTNVLFFDGHVKWMQQKPTFKAIPLPTPVPKIYRFLPPTPKSKASPSLEKFHRSKMKVWVEPRMTKAR